MNEVRAISIFVRAAALGSLRRAAIDQGFRRRPRVTRSCSSKTRSACAFFIARRAS